LDHLLIKDQIAFCLFPEEFSNGLKKVYDFFNQDMLFGWQSGNIVSKEELIKLATLPSKEQLYSQLIFFLSFTLSELVRVLQLVLDKK
jgi:ribosomal protein L10